MKRTALLSTMVLGLVMILTISAASQGDVTGKWTQVGVEGASLIISNATGKYTATYVMGETTCQLGEVTISGNTIGMKGHYSGREGFTTDLVFNLTLSNDKILLTGTRWSDTKWIAKDGQAMHAEETNEVVFTK